MNEGGQWSSFQATPPPTPQKQPAEPKPRAAFRGTISAGGRASGRERSCRRPAESIKRRRERREGTCRAIAGLGRPIAAKERAAGGSSCPSQQGRGQGKSGRDMEEEAEKAGAEPRRRRSRRHSSGRRSSERSPSPGRLDVSSPHFDPLLALYSERTPLPYPAAPCFNNLAEYESFQRGLLRAPGRPRATAGRSSRSAGTRARSRAGRAAADPERLQRLRNLMLVKEPTPEAAERARARGRRAPRNVLTKMPRKLSGV